MLRFSLALTLALAISLTSNSAFSEVSTSDPLWDWKYEAIERLSLALGERTVSNTRPMSRLEMARMALRLAAKVEAEGGAEYYKALLGRLKDDLKEEIEGINSDGSVTPRIRPLRWVRVKTVHSDEPFQLENDYGFKAEDLSLRGELSTAGAFGFLGYELRPQFNLYRDSQNDDQADLHSGYLVIWLKNLEIEVGKDSLWWGPGRHGSWLLTNNAPAFELIKLSNAVTTVPPFPLKFLGDTKFTAFLGRLSEQRITTEEKERKPLLAGFRLDFSPSRYMEFGGAQTVEFIDRGGRGYTLDYIRRTFIASWENNEEEGTSGPVANRITSADLTIKIDGQHDFMKYAGLEGMKIYWEVGGETMARDNTTKIPRFSNTSNIFGLYLDTGKTDFRAEYASTYDAPTKWYNHYQFGDNGKDEDGGYRNKGFILGHHMGGHSRDLFLSISHPLTDNIITALHFDREEHKGGPMFREDAYGLSIDAFSKRGGKVTISYEYRNGDDPENINQVWAAEGLYRF